MQLAITEVREINIHTQTFRNTFGRKGLKSTPDFPEVLLNPNSAVAVPAAEQSSP